MRLLTFLVLFVFVAASALSGYWSLGVLAGGLVFAESAAQRADEARVREAVRAHLPQTAFEVVAEDLDGGAA